MQFTEKTIREEEVSNVDVAESMAELKVSDSYVLCVFNTDLI